MFTIGIVDEGVGGVYAYTKLKQSLCANYQVKVINNDVPLGNLNKGQLIRLGKTAVDELVEQKCNVIVLSSIALTNACFKLFSGSYSVPVFGCEPPINHACTYTASNVLVVGDRFVTDYVKLPNAITCALSEFPVFAETYNERKIVDYLRQNLEQFDGQFDCIALANSSMNLYKSCFKRVFPNVQIFDSLDGVSRRLRKRYKKSGKDDSFCVITDTNGANLTEKYSIFLE